MPSSTPVIFYTGSLAILDRKRWILALRYSKGGLYLDNTELTNDLENMCNWVQKRANAFEAFEKKEECFGA